LFLQSTSEIHFLSFSFSVCVCVRMTNDKECRKTTFVLRSSFIFFLFLSFVSSQSSGENNVGSSKHNDEMKKYGVCLSDRAAKKCADVPGCRAKFVLRDGATDSEDDLRDTIESVLESHGIDKKADERLGQCVSSDEAAAMIVAELHIACVRPVDFVEHAATIHHLGAAILVVVVAILTHIGLFVLWGAKGREHLSS